MLCALFTCRIVLCFLIYKPKFFILLSVSSFVFPIQTTHKCRFYSIIATILKFSSSTTGDNLIIMIYFKSIFRHMYELFYFIFALQPLINSSNRNLVRLELTYYKTLIAFVHKIFSYLEHSYLT